MRILQLASGGLVGGVIKVCIEQTVRLRAIGHDTIVALSNPIQPHESLPQASSLPIYAKFNLKLPSNLMSYADLLAQQFLEQFCEPENP